MSRQQFEYDARHAVMVIGLLLGGLLAPCAHATPIGGGGGGPQLEQPSTPAEAQYRSGIAGLAKGDLESAEKGFKESLKLDPKNVPSLVGMAEVSLKKNRPQDVREFLQKALDLAPKSAEVQTAWGRFMNTQKKFGEAEAAFKKAIALNPQAGSPRLDLGDLYLTTLNKPKEALEVFRGVLAIDAGNAAAHFGAGRALAVSGDVTQALVELKESARLAPDNPMPLSAIGRLHASRKEYDKALEAFADALKVQPKFVQARVDRGDVFLAQGQDDKALDEFNAALKDVPKLAAVQVRVGMLHERAKRATDAERAYLAAIEADPNQAIAYNNLAYMAAERKAKLDEALVWAKKAVDLAPKAAGFQDTLGWVHRARGELDKALPVLEKAAAVKPETAEIVYHLGVVYAEKGKAKEAAASLEKALTIKKDFAGADDARKRLEALGRSSSKSSGR